MMILVILFAVVSCALIVCAVIAVKLALFLIGILLVCAAVALAAAPLVAAAALAIHSGRASASTDKARQFRSARLAVIAAGAAAAGVLDIIWIAHSLHWSHAPIVGFLLIGGITAGALVPIQEPVEPWRETPVATGDHA